jgi:hypothetical protein
MQAEGAYTMSDVYQLNIVGSVAQEYVENILHIESNVTGSHTPAEIAADVIQAWMTGAETPYVNCLPMDYILAGYRCKRLAAFGGGPTVTLPRSGITGGRGANSVTSGQSPLLVFPVTVMGNPKRHNVTGKLFLPGIALEDIIGNVLQASLVTAIQTLAGVMVGLLTGGLGTYQYGIYSAAGGFVAPTVGNPSLLVGTQRRRLHPIL